MSKFALKDFCIDPELGFLRKDPLERLSSPQFAPWETLVDDLPSYLAAGAVGDLVKQLPLVDTDSLTDSRELERAMLVLSLIGHAYVFEPIVGVPSSRKKASTTSEESKNGHVHNPEPQPRQSLPEAIARPWIVVARKLERQPVASHASLALTRYKILNPQKPPALSNIRFTTPLIGGIDEAWFFTATQNIEIVGAKGLPLVFELRNLMSSESPLEEFLPHLTSLAGVIRDIGTSLDRMYEKCDPYVFYNRLRPFLAAWRGNDQFPNGLKYEKCADFLQKDTNPELQWTSDDGGLHFRLHGASAGQSTLLTAFDAGLGIAHKSQFLTDMLQYMPHEHVRFVKFLRGFDINSSESESNQTPAISLPDYINSRSDDPRQSEALELYNSCVKAQIEFRSSHIRLVTRYVLLQSKSAKTERGTGGSSLMEFLKRIRDSTKQDHAK